MEHLITITLTPQICSEHRIKGQLRLTYQYMRHAFKSGMGCLEFTKNGNCHYHLKTQDDISDVHVFLDRLKSIRSMVNNKKVFVFGFTQCDQTKDKKMIKNYDYLSKSSVSVDQTLKKLKLSDKYNSLWVFEQQGSTFNAIKRSRAANPTVSLSNLFTNLHRDLDVKDESCSDTQIMINR